MQATLDSSDYDMIANEVIKRIVAKYDLVPKKHSPERLLTVKDFQQQLPVRKREDWIRNDLFYRNPELKQFAFNLNAGKGRPLKINPKAIDWINGHLDEIDWRG